MVKPPHAAKATVDYLEVALEAADARQWLKVAMNAAEASKYAALAHKQAQLASNMNKADGLGA